MKKGYIDIRIYFVLGIVIVGIIFITLINKNLKPVLENRYNKIEKMLQESQ